MEPVQFIKNETAAAVIARIYQKTPKAYMHSFGCQQNVNDGELIRGVLSDIGYEICDKPEDADLVILNTCAVREHAEQRVFGNIGALKPLKESKSGMLIAVCGCMMQQKPIVDKLKKSYPYVDIVFGVNKISQLPQLIADKMTLKKKQYALLEECPDIIEGMPIRRDSTFRAWLPIMYGCDNYCSYCVVPYVRGRERSRTSADVLAEFTQLVESGYKEITLLGQNVNSYGKGLEEKTEFVDLLQLLDAVPGDYRLRFMTSHPKDASRKLIDVIAASTHVCHHLHLPVQSGSDTILCQMNRRYTASDYKGLIDYAKKAAPDMTYSSDVIVGFPGETEEDFEQTLSLIRDVRYMQLFTFIYSKRGGTRAADMPDKTTYREKTMRITKILRLQEEIVAELGADMKGKTVRVLVETVGKEDGMLFGRLDNNMSIEFAGDAPLVGDFVTVQVNDFKGAVLKGTLQ